VVQGAEPLAILVHPVLPVWNGRRRVSVDLARFADTRVLLEVGMLEKPYPFLAVADKGFGS
jgi:hypothetical protein